MSIIVVVVVAVVAEIQADRLFLKGLVGNPDGSVLLRAEGEASLNEAETLGHLVAEKLLSQGAGRILAELY